MSSIFVVIIRIRTLTSCWQIYQQLAYNTAGTLQQRVDDLINYGINFFSINVGYVLSLDSFISCPLPVDTYVYLWILILIE